jgi:hypothetical protein
LAQADQDFAVQLENSRSAVGRQCHVAVEGLLCGVEVAFGNLDGDQQPPSVGIFFVQVYGLIGVIGGERTN